MLNIYLKCKEMNNDTDNSIELLIEKSKRIDFKTFNLTRCTILMLLSRFKDGLQFRELKSFLSITDGNLQSNLTFLREIGFIKRITTRIDQRSIQIYMIEDLGNFELIKIINWINLLEHLVESKNDSKF